MIGNFPLNSNEKIIFSLRSLFESYGYSLYKMSKFEEYDLYSKNKEFLISDGVIAFTDTNGKLMALKPDVTLSIVKNTANSKGMIQKLYYNENVYRVSKSSHNFKEIMQVGLECIGKIDSFSVFEVLTLALKSLSLVSQSYILDVSSLDILKGVLDFLNVPNGFRADIIHYIGEKNQHELARLCSELQIPTERYAVLKELVSINGSPESAFDKMNGILKGVVDENTLSEFENIINALDDRQCVNIDFSVVDDINYYNGIVFKGFVEGVPNSVLSGGRYDSLMKKMKRSEKAIGFAVYLDMLEHLNAKREEYDVDTVIVYDGQTDFDFLQKTADGIRKENNSVLLLNDRPEDIRYKRLIKIINGEVTDIETNA